MNPRSVSDSCRLVDTDQIGGREAIYTTLSYCWGPPRSRPPLNTTEANVQQHYQGIALETLPKTYKGAFLVTRSLGVRYIWIDALCILQSKTDLSDWETESVKMFAIFQHSLVTISATSSTDAHDGRYLDRRNESLFMTVTSGPLARSLVLEGKSYRVSIHNIADSNVVVTSPMNERAWILRELVLSPRVVHFTDHQIWWQCRTDCASEDATSYDATPAEEFLRKRLTYESDTLPAFAGLTR